VRIVLYGRLRKKFAPEYRLGVSTPKMALYALIRTVPDFEQELAKGGYRLVRGNRRTGMHLDAGMLCFKLNGDTLHIMPAAMGRAKSGAIGGAIKIVLGVVLISLAVATGFGAFGAAGWTAGVAGAGGTTGLYGISAAQLGIVGAGLLFSGIGQILTHIPKPPAADASFLLSPPSNTDAQGGPVPVAYGFEVRVGSTTISAGYQAIAMVAGQYETNTGTLAYPYGNSPVDGWGGLDDGGGNQKSGGVVAIEAYTPGTGYSYCNVEITPTDGGSGATAVATLSAGSVSAITVTNEGSGYNAAPVITLLGDGTGAAAIATVSSED